MELPNKPWSMFLSLSLSVRRSKSLVPRQCDQRPVCVSGCLNRHHHDIYRSDPTWSASRSRTPKKTENILCLSLCLSLSLTLHLFSKRTLSYLSAVILFHSPPLLSPASWQSIMARKDTVCWLDAQICAPPNSPIMTSLAGFDCMLWKGITKVHWVFNLMLLIECNLISHQRGGGPLTNTAYWTGWWST